MVTSDDFETYELSQFLLDCDLTEIPIIDIITIDKRVLGRVDIILNKYYQKRLYLIPLLLEFNNINDITEMKIGLLFKIPDFDFYLNHLNIIDFLDDEKINNIPGVLTNVNNFVINKESEKIKTSLNQKTLANSKLGIELGKSKIYNNDTGILTF